MYRFLSAMFVAGTLAVFGCGPPPNGGTDGGTNNGTDGGGNSNPNACGTGHAQVTAQQLYDTVIKIKCQSCHYAGANPVTNGDLVMDSVAALKANVGQETFGYKPSAGTVLKVVDANHSETSTMYLKVLNPPPKGPEGQSLGARMPQGGAELPEAEKKMIQDWICTGAQ